MSKKLIVIVTVSFLFRCVLYAGEIKKGNLNFYNEITQFSALCLREICEYPYSKEVIFHYQVKNNLDKNLKKNLARISYKQAQIWADTILEGDFVAEGNTRLDEVSNLYKNNELFGYLITYSEMAWNTSDCRYDGIHDSTLKGCVQGRITESSYVSLDYKEYFYDEKTMATFK